MSDMNDLCRVYSAVHNSEVKKEITEARDAFSEMDLSKMTKSDLYEMAEEIFEEIFSTGLTLKQVDTVLGSVMEEVSSVTTSEFRADKIERLAEAFDEVFEKVTENSERNCVEMFLKYRKNKPLNEKWYSRVNHEQGNDKIHAALIAQDKKNIKESILSLVEKKVMDSSYLETNMKKRQENNEKARKDMKKMGTSMKNPHFEEVSQIRKDWSGAYSSIYEKKLDPVGQEDGDIDNDGDEDSSDKYLAKRRKAIAKAMGKDKEEMKETYTVTNADKKGNTKAYQNYKAGMKKKDGSPMYKAADHMKESKFSEAELKAIEEKVNSWED
jgi:hypothetical protein|tara:strand:- start:9522 stop:10499 length:978 start_codon:yes stop_codon:yes gene_type:complete